jgi:hypothetical protein
MTAADRYQALAIVTGGIAAGTGSIAFFVGTVCLLWGAVIHLSSTVREQRRMGRKAAHDPIHQPRGVQVPK